MLDRSSSVVNNLLSKFLVPFEKSEYHRNNQLNLVMILFVLTYFKAIKLSPQSINSWIQSKKFGLLVLALRRYGHGDRREILACLGRRKISNTKVVRQLIYIVRNDFFENANFALEILRHNDSIDPLLQQQIDDAGNVLQDKMRRTSNQRDFYRKYKGKLYKEVSDKSQMVRLAQVKQKLKKPIRLY